MEREGARRGAEGLRWGNSCRLSDGGGFLPDTAQSVDTSDSRNKASGGVPFFLTQSCHHTLPRILSKVLLQDPYQKIIFKSLFSVTRWKVSRWLITLFRLLGWGHSYSSAVRAGVDFSQQGVATWMTGTPPGCREGAKGTLCGSIKQVVLGSVNRSREDFTAALLTQGLPHWGGDAQGLGKHMEPWPGVPTPLRWLAPHLLLAVHLCMHAGADIHVFPVERSGTCLQTQIGQIAQRQRSAPGLCSLQLPG